MKSFLKIILSTIFLFSFPLLFPSPIQADFGCATGGAIITPLGDDFVRVAVTLTGLSATDMAMPDGYFENLDLIYKKPSPDLTVATKATILARDTDEKKVFLYFDVPKTTVNTSNMLNNLGNVLFWVQNSDYCTFYLTNDEITIAYYTDASGDVHIPGDPDDVISTSCSSTYGAGSITGLGCIPTDPENLAKWILSKAILMGGGIAFLLSLFGGITIILAAGNPEKISQGKEIITSAVSGILLIIFSVFLLRLIGVDILQLPGFS